MLWTALHFSICWCHFSSLSLIGVGIFLFEKGEHLREDTFAVADDGEIDPHIFADRSGIDVDMDDLGLGGKGLDLSGHPVIKRDPMAIRRSDSITAILAR